MNILKKIVKWIINGLTVFLLAILLIIIYGKISITFGNKGYPNYFGYTFFAIASGSMEPTLYIDDVILVKIGQDNFKENDIIAFKTDNAVITHRILYISGDSITVKGDNNNTIDSPIQRNQVIGKVIKIFPKLSIWKKIISEPKIIIVLFVTLILFDFALAYNPPKEENKKEEKKKEKKEEVKIVKIESEKPKKEYTDKLLDFTRKIDIEEINKLIEDQNTKLSNKEIENLKKEIDKPKEDINLSNREKEFLDYTMRLDLSEIQKKINKKIK